MTDPILNPKGLSLAELDFEFFKGMDAVQAAENRARKAKKDAVLKDRYKLKPGQRSYTQSEISDMKLGRYKDKNGVGSAERLAGASLQEYDGPDGRWPAGCSRLYEPRGINKAFEKVATPEQIKKYEKDTRAAHKIYSELDEAGRFMSTKEFDAKNAKRLTLEIQAEEFLLEVVLPVYPEAKKDFVAGFNAEAAYYKADPAALAEVYKAVGAPLLADIAKKAAKLKPGK